jgi:hypothetical protein
MLTAHFYLVPRLRKRRAKSRDSSMVQRWVTGWMIGGSSPGRGRNFSLHYCVQTGSGAYTASYTMGTRVSFPGGKAAGE